VRQAPLAIIGALLLASAGAQDTRLVLLGTGTPNPDPERSGPAVAVVSGTNVYIVDAGPGVVRRAVQAGIRMDQLTRAFLTHLHSDHTVGLPDLIFTPAVSGRRAPFELYGPPGTSAMMQHILEAWSEDMDIRLHGLEPSVKQAYVIHAHDVLPGEVYRDAAVHVTAIAVPHGTWKHAYGYRFDAGDKSARASRRRRKAATSWCTSSIPGKAGKAVHRTGSGITRPFTRPRWTWGGSRRRCGRRSWCYTTGCRWDSPLMRCCARSARTSAEK